MKKGFTLIELLAIILILGFLTLIATPIIINVIDDSKESTYKNDAKLFVSIVNQKLMEGKVNKDALEDGIYSITPDGNLCIGDMMGKKCYGRTLDLNLKNEVPKCGSLKIKNNKIIGMTGVQFGELSVNYNNKKYNYTKTDGCIFEEIDTSCFVSTIPGELNDYICDDEEIIIPNMVLPISELSAIKFNKDKCMTSNPEVINEAACDWYNANFFEGKTLEEILSLGLETVSLFADLEYKTVLPIQSEKITIIGESAFSSNTIIKSVTFSSNINEIKESAFSNAISLENISFKGNDVIIGESAFSDCNIKELEINDSIKKIGQDAFADNGMTSLKITSSNLDTIGNYAFQDNELISLDISGSLKTIGNSAFKNNKLTDVKISNSVETIGDSAFLGSDGYNKITKLTFEPNSNLKYIGSSAFSDNVIESLEIPNSVEKIESNAFKNNSIKTLKLGNNVTTIGQSAFSDNLIESLILTNNLSTIETNAFKNNQIKKLVIPSNIEKIGSYAFQYNIIEDLTIENGVKEISNYAFSHNKLTNVKIPDSVTSIESYAFNCNNISTIEIGSGITGFGYYSFKGATETYTNTKTNTSVIYGPNQLTSVTINKAEYSVQIFNSAFGWADKNQCSSHSSSYDTYNTCINWTG